MNELDQAFFKKNGYYIAKDIFSDRECENLISAAHRLNPENDFTPLMNKHKDSQSILDFMKNKKLISFVEKYFNGKALGLQTEFFFMPPGTQGFSPHQDNFFVDARGDTFISAWIALTDVCPENGGLIIWPKTHMEKKLEVLTTGEKLISNQDPNANKISTVVPKKYKGISPSLKKGTILFIDKWLVHSSNMNQSNNYRHALLCTYIKEGAYFKKGSYAKREAFSLNES